MKTLIINISIAHQNTLKVARVLAQVFNCEIKKPSEVENKDLKNYDLIGFGSGIYFMKHYKTLLNFVDNISDMSDKKAFIFSTSGLNKKIIVKRMHKALREKLLAKNFDVIAEFNCPGWDTWGPYKFTGGLNKNRPNKKDLEEAIIFANKLVK